MTKKSLTALYRINRYSLFIITLILTCPVSALAKGACNTNPSSIVPTLATNSGISSTGTAVQEIEGIRDTADAEGGIGGTGIVAKDGGIGGTGIIGIITEFASICVNNIEIHYDTNTPVFVDGKAATVDDLAVGKIIAARTLSAGNDFTAHNISIFHAAVGPISNLDHGTRKLYLLAQTVQIGQSQDQDAFLRLKAGDWVQVSGHRLSDNVIVASRIESILPLTEVRINGYVTQADDKSFEVNGTRVNHDSSINIKQGMEVLVIGNWEGTYLKAQYVQAEPTRQAVGDVERVIREGYIHALHGEGFNVNNQIMTFDPDTQITVGSAREELKLDQFIQVSGQLDKDQNVVAEHIELKHEFPVQFYENFDANQDVDRGEIKENPAKSRLSSGLLEEVKVVSVSNHRD